MRTSLIFLLLFPIFASAQINRSAKELAGENIEVYLKKIFKNQPHNVISLGEPQQYLSNVIDADWMINCRVSSVEKKMSKGTGTEQTLSDFRFYLDKKMQVVFAEAYKPRSN